MWQIEEKELIEWVAYSTDPYNVKNIGSHQTIRWIFFLVKILWTRHVLLNIAPNANEKPSASVQL